MTVLWVGLIVAGIVMIAVAVWPSLRRNRPDKPGD